MKITLNNRPETIDKDNITISELLNAKYFTFKMMITKINGRLIKKNERDSAIVEDGDDVQVIHMISGG